MSVMKEEIDRWLGSEGQVSEYRQGMESLRRSGILNLLRRLGTPIVVDKGASLEVMAGQAHWANGFQACIDHLVYFERLFVQDSVPVLEPPDFGGVAMALKNGSLREDDLV